VAGRIDHETGLTENSTGRKRIVAAATLIDNLRDAPAWIRKGGAVSVGNFDGVHRGHACIIQRLVRAARQVEGPAIVFSFQPHPACVLRPAAAPAALTTAPRKADLLGKLGVDALIAYPTDTHILGLEPGQFFQQVVVQHLAARAMVEGPNFRFGRRRVGSIQLLADLCQQAGIALEVVSPLLVGDRYVSSSRIRTLLADGKIPEANALLTEPYRLCGTVVVGARRGRTIGFPTANLDLDPHDLLLPPRGVYAGRAMTATGTWAAAIHFGPNPTFDDQSTKLEIHLIDFTGDLYGTHIDVEFLARIRAVRQFDGRQALIDQLTDDIKTARALAGEGTA